jgi:hypothetical protein
MDFYRSAKGSLWVTLLLVLLVLPIFGHVAAAQSQPVVGPSGVSEETSTPSDLRSRSRSTEGPVTAPAETFGVEGGADIPLGGTNEPAIVVNPLNPNNIAMASLFALRVSTNNGNSFSAPTTAVVPAGYNRAGDPSLAFDSQARLFWTYLGARTDNGNFDVFISQVNPSTGAILAGYPVNVTAGAGFPASVAANNNDKEWLAADRFSGSLFQDQLYVVWTRFAPSGTSVHTTFSADQGSNWSAASTVSGGGEGFVWPSHNAVARNGDVYVAYHSQPTFVGGAPNGTSGQVFVLRSTNGGVSYPQKTLAYTPGNADITFNVQNLIRTLNGSVSWTQGSAQPWVLPDPINLDNVYVVAADDPTNLSHGDGFDDMDVFIARSTNQGLNWDAPVRVDAGPVGTTQFFPTATIDDESGCFGVTWYDTRAGLTNAAGNFLLDVFLRNSCDGGLTFSPEVKLNDVPFDPDLGAPTRFPGPPPTLRIGEYIGAAIANGFTHAVWTGNTATGQQTLYDRAIVQANVNDLVAFVPISSSFDATTNTSGCPAGFVGKFSFNARLTDPNTSPALSDLLGKVTTLTNNNLLQNADGGPGGVGATFTVPKSGDFSDGVLSPGEFVDVPFVICLKQFTQFSFFVDVLGVVDTD